MRSRRALAALVVAATGLAVVAASPATATIEPQRSIAGISVGMTGAQVRQVLGAPLATVRGSNDFGPYTQLRYPFRVVVTLQGRTRVTSVSTSGVRERTANGIGVGSTRAQVLARVRGARCESSFGIARCYVGSFEPGTRVTDFLLEAGRVTRVTVGTVID